MIRAALFLALGAAATPAFGADLDFDPMQFGGSPDPFAFDYVVIHEGQEFILPHCPTEDSSNCFWNAEHVGNGRGQAFYNLGGTVYFVAPDPSTQN